MIAGLISRASAISSTCTTWQAASGGSQRNRKDCRVEEESVDKVEWEDKVEKVEKQECSVDVVRK